MCVMTIEGWKIVADVIGHVVWPVLVAVVLVWLRKPVFKFISEIEEAVFGPAKVKRGNQQSKQLRNIVEYQADQDDVGDASDAGEGPDTDERVDTPGTQHRDSLDLESTGVLSAAGAVLPDTTGSASDRAATLRYYGRIVDNRLENSKYNISTTSARLGSELVGNSYADLKQTVRMVAFTVQGVGGTRGRLPGLLVTLRGLNLPDELERDIIQARTLAEDVTTGSVRVDGQGASDYIDSVRTLVGQLIAWGIRAVGEQAN